MGLDFDSLSPQELLAAESAVLVMRSLMQAVKTAPQGQGMACVESALHEKGFEHLRTMLTAAAASHEGVPKRGLQLALLLRQNRLVQTVQGQEHPEQRGAYRCSPPLLRLPALQGQTNTL